MVSSYDNTEDEDYDPAPGEHYYDQIILSKLPKTIKKLDAYKHELTAQVESLKQDYLDEIEAMKSKAN
jgi:hypothetical protein